jgi:hypothetical protein
MRHPLYLLFAAITCAFLLMANARGWSLIGKAFTAASGGRAGLYHK